MLLFWQHNTNWCHAFDILNYAFLKKFGHFFVSRPLIDSTSDKWQNCVNCVLINQWDNKLSSTEFKLKVLLKFFAQLIVIFSLFQGILLQKI